MVETRVAQLVVTVADDRVTAAKRAAARKLAKQVNIPGFRKGKVPYNVLVRYITEEGILDAALDDLTQDIYKEALQAEDLDPAGPGELEEVTRDPMVLTYKVPLQPEVDLGDYRSVRVDYTPEAVEEGDIEDMLEAAQERNAVIEPVERAAELGDIVTLTFKGVMVDEDDPDDEDEMFAEEDYDLTLEDDGVYPMPGFYDEVIGMKAGETREFTIAYPDDFHNRSLIGEKVKNTVTVSTVKGKSLPELDDDFAQEASNGEAETMADYRASIREQLETMRGQQYDNEYSQDVLKQIVAGATVTYADLSLNQEIDAALERESQDARQRGLTMEDYLKIQGKTEEEMRADLKPDAEENLKTSAVMQNIVLAENITINDADIDAQIDRMFYGGGNIDDEMRQMLRQSIMSSQESIFQLTNQAISSKAVDRIVLIGKGEAPDLDAEDAADEAPAADAAPAAETAGEPEAEDKLSKIEGIGPKIDEILKAAGIKTFQALADADVDSLKAILADAGGRYKSKDPSTWPQQAALAAAGDKAGLKALQDELKGGRAK